MEKRNTKCYFIGIIIIEVVTVVNGLLKPRYVGPWWNMDVNNKATTDKYFYHNFMVLPAKVEVQVKSPITGFIYSGVMSTYNDGEQSVHAGVTAMYSTSSVRVVGATNFGTSGGNAFILNTGISSWTPENLEQFTSADIRVRAWHPDDLPSPTFSESGFYMTAADDNSNYKEIVHGIGEKPALTVVQYRFSNPSYSFYVEAQGTSSHVNGIANLGWGGIVFGVDEQRIRLWAPSSTANGLYGVYNACNGWGDASYSPSMCRINQGEIVIKIWRDLESVEIFSHTSKHSISETGVTHEYSFVHKFNMDEDLVAVESMAVDGYNSGYYFQAAGAATFDDGYSLAGLLFAYSNESEAIRLWHPTTNNSYIVKVGPDMGAMASFEQYSRDVNTTIKIWRGLKCPPLPSVSDTSITSTISTTTYTCDSGFALASGTLIRQCQINDTWSGSTPVCGYCIGLPNPTNGQVTSTNNLEGGIATYGCDAGFSLVGSASSTCIAGAWSGMAPACETDICSALTNPTNGLVTSTNNLEGGIATFICDTSFSLVGPVTSTCSAGTWSGSTAPTCEADICTSLTVPSNGQVVSANNLEGGITSFSCDAGFSLVGSDTSTCSAGVWSGTVPTCEADICTSLTNPTNGRVESTNNLEGGIATYSCDAGFSLVGSATSTCSAGTWSGTAPTCNTDICTALTNPTNGQVASTNNLEGGIATFSCDSGFSLVGSATSTCIAGTWSGLPPSCDAEKCEEIETGEHTILDIMMLTLNGSASFTCVPGYHHVSGNLTRDCMKTVSGNSWSGTPPVCSKQNVSSNTSDAEKIAEEIVANLTVPIKSTGKYERTLISVHDERRSAFCIGLFGALVCAGVIVLPVLSDVMNIIHGACSKTARKGK